MKSHAVVFIVDERYPSISHISHKQIKMSFDAFTKTSRLARKKGYFSYYNSRDRSDLCPYEVLLPKFNQIVNLIEITWNPINRDLRICSMLTT